MDTALDDLKLARESADWRETWQVRVLIETQRSHIGTVMLSALAHTYDDAMFVMMRVAFPGFKSITPPFLCSAGKVDKNGAVVADVVQRAGTIKKDVCLYTSEIQMRDELRRLADRMRLNDADRVEMFKVVQRWVVADRRLDPTMNPADPDAKRLVH